MKHLLVAAAVTAGMWLATPAWADPFFFSTGSPDGLLGALSQPPDSGQLETETADDFILTETTSIAQATITGLIPSGTLGALMQRPQRWGSPAWRRCRRPSTRFASNSCRARGNQWRRRRTN
jgi:hypothetical protein